MIPWINVHTHSHVVFVLGPNGVQFVLCHGINARAMSLWRYVQYGVLFALYSDGIISLQC